MCFKLEKPEDLGRFVAPPYDMLDTAMVDDLYRKDPHNVVRIIQNKPEASDKANADRHHRAAKLFRQWIDDRIIVRDKSPSVYFYQQQFHATSGTTAVTRTRTGVIALVKLVDYEAGIVFPHEYTLTEPKVDRYELLKAMEGHAELVFGIVPDSDASFFSAISSALPPAFRGSFVDSNMVRHSLFHSDDTSVIASLTNTLKDRTILIADGHHRYETALKFSRDMGRPEHDYVMMNLVSMTDPGLLIRAFHRVLRKYPGTESVNVLDTLGAYFDCSEERDASLRTIGRFLGAKNGGPDMLYLDAASRSLFGLYLKSEGEKFLRKHSRGMSEQWNHLDVSKINSIVIDGILHLTLDGKILHDVMDYVNDPQAAFEKVASGKGASAYHGAFFIRPVDINTITTIVMGKERMPQKSTNFFPKCYSGLVFDTLEP
jgi:uncharacterized protein (DUF1015 family)